MTPVLQVMIGFGLGLIGALLLTPLAIGYATSHSNSRSRKQNNDYFSQPGQRCPICLDDLESHSMQYLKCGHALHDNCLREYRKTASICPTCREKM